MSLGAIIAQQIAGAIATQLVQSVTVPGVQPVDKPQVEAIVKAEVAPTIQHLTNNEPWYQSRVTWGALISGAASIAIAFGVSVDAIDVEQATAVMVALGGVVGSAITLYGRWKAKKPIGA